MLVPQLYRDILLDYRKNFRECSALTAAIAYDLLFFCEGEPLQVVVCWWIASKFEDVTPLEISYLLKTHMRVHVAVSAALQTEATILEKCNWRIPYKTTVRDMYDVAHSHRLHIRDVENWAYVVVDLAAAEGKPVPDAQTCMEALQTPTSHKDLLLSMQNKCQSCFLENIDTMLFTPRLARVHTWSRKTGSKVPSTPPIAPNVVPKPNTEHFIYVTPPRNRRALWR